MALKVWLPLNGDLENKGISDNISFSVVSGNSFTSGGKIGGDALKLTKLQQILNTSSCMTGAKEISYAFWVKVNTAWSANWLDGIRWISTDGSSTATERQEFYTNCTYVGTWYKGGAISGKSFTPGVWTHLAATINYNTGQSCFYINGVLQGSASNVDTTYYCRGDFYIGDNGVDILENDVRIYDHCLSQKEIKEISQGLILHYKLDGFSGGVGENLLLGTKFDSLPQSGTGNVRIYNGAISNHSIANNEDTILLNSTSNLGIGFYRPASEINLDPSSYYTLSCWAKCSQSRASLAIGLSYQKTDDTWVWRGGTNKKAFISINQWQYFTLTFKPDANTKTIEYCFTVNGIKGGTETYTLKHCKLEKGSVATPWIPAPEDLGLDTTKIVDSSGYEHNGIIINTILTELDSPRYQIATHIDNTSSKIKIDNFQTSGFSNSYTFAWWAKINSVNLMHWGFANGIRLNGLYTGRLWNTGDSGNNPLYNPGTTIQVTAPSVNVWHHWVMTGDGTKCLVYQDGELWAEAKTYKSISGTIIYINGWNDSTQYSSNNFSIADFRIYATALSAEDILDLYHTPANIDNLGGIHGFEFTEETQGRELMALPWTTPYTKHNKTSINNNYNNNGELVLVGSSTSAGSDYIRINPTGKTYYYDTEISISAGNQFYLGFERYDVNKTTRSNNACVYAVAIKPTADIIHQRYSGTINLATDGVNPTDTITLRILNAWSGTDSNSTKEATIHYLSLREVDGNPQTGKIKQQGQIYTDEFAERDGQASIYQNGFVGGNNFIEK